MSVPAETWRLRFRPIAIGDLPLYSALYGDSETMRHIGPPVAEADAAINLCELVDTCGAAACGWTLWVLVLQSGGGSDDIGIGGLCRAGCIGEIGIMLLPSWRSRGIAAEAIHAIRDHAFRCDQLAAVFTTHGVNHRHAERLMQKLGFARQPAGEQVRWSCRNACSPVLADARAPLPDLEPPQMQGVAQ